MNLGDVIVRVLLLAAGITIGTVGVDLTTKLMDRLDRLEARTCDCPSQEPRLGVPGRPDQVR